MKRSNFLIVLFSFSTFVILNESCASKEDDCPTINCNAGNQNELTCDCDCPIGFSGTNCELEDLCVTQDIECLNGGTCVDGSCDCPEGYIGTNCENFDTSKVQALLNAGQTPKSLYDGGVPLDSLYGKMYEGGLIFYLNTNDGSGLVSATADNDARAAWGCRGIDIPGLNNVTTCADDCMPPEPQETAEGARIGDGVANTDAILAGCNESGIAAEICRNLGAEWFLPSRGELDLMYTNLHLRGYGGFTSGSVLYWSSTEGAFPNGDNAELFAWVQNFDDGVQSLGSNQIDTIYLRAARAF